MLAVKRLIEELIDDENQIFVFPSEIVAEFWRRESLTVSRRGAIWEDRFCSWDRFKEQAFQLSQRAAPINRIMRTLFAADLLRQNSISRPLFAALINPEYAESSPAFLRTITSMLPELAHYRDLPTGLIDPATHTDLTFLWHRYQAFLQENGLFEPSYDRIDLSTLTKHHHVFFPEVIEDWPEAEPYLDTAHIHPVVSEAASSTPIRRFENSVQEMRSLFIELSALLEQGIEPADIAITVPRLSVWASLLQRDAELMGVPLDIRQGRALAEYPETRLFFRLRDAVRGGFSLEAMKSLFTCRAYPWRHRAAGEALVRWGIDHHCVGRYRSEGQSHDLWEEKLTGAANSLRGFYTSLTREVAGLVGSRGFAGLRERLQRFVNGWLDTTRWNPESLHVFQFALNALNDLVDGEERLTGMTVTDPYQLWLDTLGERLYVPRSRAAGIAVYPYRVSAGIEPSHHFLLGATQEATQVQWRPLSFLREDERAALGVEDRNATEAFLNLYLQSGIHVALSFSDLDFSGVELPPGYFVLRGAVEPPGDVDAMREIDPYERETSAWSGTASASSRLRRMQQTGARSFDRCGAGKLPKRITAAPLDDAAVVAALVELLSDDEGRLRISPTRLDRFWECPFSFLFSAALKVEERAYEIEWEDPRLIGALMHEILRRLFDRIAASDGRFDPIRGPAYRDLASKALSAVFSEWEARGDSLAPPVWFGLGQHLLERLDQFLTVEATQFGGLAVEALEKSYRRASGGVLLEGRIDRVSGDKRGAVLVDYKRNNRLRPADLLGRATSKGPSSYQIPFYIALLESVGRKVRTAAYYDIEKGRYHIVFDADGAKAWAGPDDLGRMLARTDAALRAMEERIRSGAWMVPDDRSGCDECRLRAVCRMKYSVR